MPTFAVGDVQGCHETLEALLAECGFREGTDRLWFVGDLVNRGPASLAVLRRVRDLGKSAVVVLGNHDMHLLAVAAGIRPEKARDTFDDVLAAPDRDDLLDWLRYRPLLHRERDRLLVHAGLHPDWTPRQAARLARKAGAVLRGREWPKILAASYDSDLNRWHDGLDGILGLAAAVRVFVKIRVLTEDGRIDDEFTGAPDERPAGTIPWYEIEGRRSEKATVVFGHWAALGFHRAPGILALDTGCVWGGELTAVRLEDGEVFRATRVEPTPRRE